MWFQICNTGPVLNTNYPVFGASPDSGNFKLSMRQIYFIQVQVEMFLTGTSYSDFIVLSPHSLIITNRVYADPGFGD